MLLPHYKDAVVKSTDQVGRIIVSCMHFATTTLRYGAVSTYLNCRIQERGSAGRDKVVHQREEFVGRLSEKSILSPCCLDIICDRLFL